MKILIIGHKGFIGKRLTQELELRGHEVIGYDIIDGHDIRNLFELDKYMMDNQCDTVIHMAARTGVGGSIKYPDEYISTNINGTNNVIEACKKNNVKRIIFFSSSSIFGGCDINHPLSENSPYNPLSLYGITKMAGEKIVENSGLQYAIIRPFTVYGENGRKDMVIYKWINNIINNGFINIYGDGDSFRGYTYVQDLVIGVCDTLNYLIEHPLKKIFINLGGEEIIHISDLLLIFEEFCNKKNINFQIERLPLYDWDINGSFADVSFAKSIIGFKTTKKFKDIVISILKNEFKKNDFIR